MSRNMAEAPEEGLREGSRESLSGGPAASGGGSGLVVGVWIGAGVFLLALAGLAAWGVNTVVGAASKIEAPSLSAMLEPEPVAPRAPEAPGAVASAAVSDVAVEAQRVVDEANRAAAAVSGEANEAAAPEAQPVVAAAPPSPPAPVAEPAAQPVAKHDFTRLRRSH